MRRGRLTVGEVLFERCSAVAIYARVSTKDQHCTNQIDLLTQWCQRQGHRITKIYTDAGINVTTRRRWAPKGIILRSAQREFDAYVAESKRIPAAQADARARITQLKDVNACMAAAGARAAVHGLVASMRAKRLARGRRGLPSAHARTTKASRSRRPNWSKANFVSMFRASTSG